MKHTGTDASGSEDAAEVEGAALADGSQTESSAQDPIQATPSSPSRLPLPDPVARGGRRRIRHRSAVHYVEIATWVVALAAVLFTAYGTFRYSISLQQGAAATFC